MARSDLDPILQERDGIDDGESSSTPDWSWICFHCHSSRSVTPSVVCICRSLKSALYRRAFYYSTRLVAGGGTCNLEYQKQVVDPPSTRRRLSQTAADPCVNDGDGQTPLLPRRFTYYECNTGDAIASSSPSSSFSLLGNMTSSDVIGDAQLGQHVPGSTCVECDNKSCSCSNGHRPNCINWLANIGSYSCGSFCSRQKQKPSSVTRTPEIRFKQLQKQQQQQVCQRSQDNDDCNNKTTTTPSTYTRCKLKHRSYDDLKTLLENFRMQVQAVSEDLVRLLEERHDVKQQIDMRNIAIEQLLRLQEENGESTTRQSQDNDAGTDKAETIQGRRQVDARTTVTGRDEQGIVTRTSEAKECFFTTTLRTIRTIE